MAIRSPKNVAGNLSAELSAAIRRLGCDAQRQSPPTLEDVRADLQQGGLEWSRDGELLYPQDRTALLIELDGLIAQYGGNASALDFVNRRGEPSR
jgi:hypothetical protein